jgi:S-adenosyl methyltransferase
MTETAESAGNQESWQALGVRTDIPHPARVYDYMLGGRDNFAADREMAERGLQLVPEMRDSSRGNRDFLIRAVAFARDAGIRQFLDIGTGLPISPNTHEVARLGHPDARVVYVDNDPVVFMPRPCWPTTSASAWSGRTCGTLTRCSPTQGGCSTSASRSR